MGSVFRLIDANLNRSSEAIRVCEDIARFILNDRPLTRAFKAVRHRIGSLRKSISASRPALLKSRNVKRDVGKKTAFREGTRKDIGSIFLANLGRAKESLRVLEEITKLLDKKKAEAFKKARFKVYELEKKSRIRLESVLHY